MNDKVQNIITDVVMDCYGELFDLDKNEVFHSLDQLSGLRKTVDISVVEEIAHYASHDVLSLITSPSFLQFVADTLVDNKTPNVGFTSAYPEEKGVAVTIDFDVFDKETVQFFMEHMSDGLSDIEGYDAGTKFVLGHMDILHYDIVRYCLHNIGTIIRFMMTDSRFYFTFRVKMKHYAEVAGSMMSDVARIHEDEAFRLEFEKAAEANSAW